MSASSLRLFAFPFLLMAFLHANVHAVAQQVTIGSFNLRFINTSDSGNLWADRRAAVANLIRFHGFDVVGTQEARSPQLKDLDSSLPYMQRFGHGRDDGKESGEFSAILFNKEKFTLLKSGDFWLSETPDKPGLGWDATCCNRICSWVLLQHRQTKKQFYVFNVHFDHQGKIARVESGKLMLQKMKEIAGNNKIVLTGDFNGGRDSDWYLRLANSGFVHDSYTDVDHPYALNGSFNAFGKGKQTNEVIDHIFLSKGLKASRWGILTDTYYGKFPSDHFPLLVDIAL